MKNNKDSFISFRLTADDKAEIEAKAKTTGLTISEYALKAALMQEIKPIEHYTVKASLIQSAGTVGKIGGLLKLLISKSEDHELINTLETLHTEILNVKDIYLKASNL